MPYHRGDVIAVPYDYSDLSGGKVRPALISSSDAYNLARPDVVAAGISTQATKASSYDYVLNDWVGAGLRYPSLVRGRLLTIEQTLIRRVVGRLSQTDLLAFESKLIGFLLSDVAIANDMLTRVEPTALRGHIVQGVAEKFVQACLALQARHEPAINIARLRALLTPVS